MAEPEPDFEAEGMLKGLRGKAREGRRHLLEELASDGVAIDELRRAVAEDRLALLPVERVLSGGGDRYTADEVAELSGVEREFLDRQWRSLGMAVPADEERVFTDRDVEAARRVAALREAGVPADGILEIARLLGMTMSQLAAANRRLIADAFLRPGDTEYDVAKRFAAAASSFSPMIGSRSYVLNLHLREQFATTRWGSPRSRRDPRERRGGGRLLRRPLRLHRTAGGVALLVAPNRNLGDVNAAAWQVLGYRWSSPMILED